MWDTKYRPVRFTDVLGQAGTVQVLKARLRKRTALDTSYLLSGGHGQGKTTLARILGRALLCQNLTEEAEPCNQCDNCADVLAENSPAFSEMDAASRGSVEHVRALVDNLAFVVAGAAKRIYLFDEAHRMTPGAQDVLLKPVEDKRLVGIFCTTEPEKIRGPIRSRCEEYPIRKITREDVLQRMKYVLDQEKVEHEDEAILTVIDHSGRHVRDILNKLEMIAQLGPITLGSVRDHLNLSVVSTYYQILLSLSNPAKATALAEEACERVGPEEVSEGLAESAMSAYRLANGMHTDFSNVDLDLAKQVYAMYGDSVLKLSEYFLRNYRISRLGLLSDIVACRGGAPATASAAPVVVQIAVPQVQAMVAQVSPETPKAPESTPSPIKTDEPVEANLRPDKIGNLGSSDPAALTSEDTKGVPMTFPRGYSAPRPIPVPQGHKEPFLIPEEWQKKFFTMLAAFRGGA